MFKDLVSRLIMKIKLLFELISGGRALFSGLFFSRLLFGHVVFEQRCLGAHGTNSIRFNS